MNLGIGAIGLRYQGSVITHKAQLYGDVVALTDVDQHVREQGRAAFGSTPRIFEDYRDMIYADTAVGIETRRKAFLRKWRLKCRAVADSLEEAGDRLFTFTRLDLSQW